MKSTPSASPVNTTGEEFLEAVAHAFPVAAWSDEFYFFPQTLPAVRDWARWDDYSEEAVNDFVSRCRSWENDLMALQKAREDREGVDALCLARAVRTLREQFEIIGDHRSRPTFHLSVAAAGLVEALEHSGGDAWEQRCTSLPLFLERATAVLRSVPAPFAAAGAAMAKALAGWLGGLPAGEEPAAAMHAFADRLLLIETREDFLLPPGQYDLLLSEHFGTGRYSGEALAVIEEEIAEMEQVLAEETSRLGITGGWREATAKIPRVPVPRGGLVELYRREAEALEGHCLAAETGLRALAGDSPLQVRPVPVFLNAIRAADAYQSLPGTPPRGGVFFVRKRSPERAAEPSIEYRMTCAHETWPGHHLLDVCRWNGGRPLRRPLERPLYYEGWACLAEELMAVTGFFDGPWDRFLLARRRLGRAVRGKIDIGIQTGRMEAREAGALLVSAGFPPAEAEAVIPKFALRPGYQVCYTLGLRRFLALLNDGFRGTPWTFARRVLVEGEIGFDELGRILADEGA